MTEFMPVALWIVDTGRERFTSRDRAKIAAYVDAFEEPYRNRGERPPLLNFIAVSVEGDEPRQTALF